MTFSRSRCSRIIDRTNGSLYFKRVSDWVDRRDSMRSWDASSPYCRESLLMVVVNGVTTVTCTVTILFRYVEIFPSWVTSSISSRLADSRHSVGGGGNLCKVPARVEAKDYDCHTKDGICNIFTEKVEFALRRNSEFFNQAKT